MKKLILIIALFLFACEEEITPTQNTITSNVLEISSDQYTEVKIDGFGSVWVNGSTFVRVPRGTIHFHACGNDGEFLHDGKNKLIIECQ